MCFSNQSVLSYNVQGPLILQHILHNKQKLSPSFVLPKINLDMYTSCRLFRIKFTAVCYVISFFKRYQRCYLITKAYERVDKNLHAIGPTVLVLFTCRVWFIRSPTFVELSPIHRERTVGGPEIFGDYCGNKIVQAHFKNWTPCHR
jgi:hypothetical protein